MSRELQPHNLPELAALTHAEQAILCTPEDVNSLSALTEGERARWQAYARLHSHAASSRFHLFAPLDAPKLLLVEHLEEGKILFLQFQSPTRIVSLEKAFDALQAYLAQAEPDALTKAVLSLDLRDLKKSNNPVQSETQPIQVNF